MRQISAHRTNQIQEFCNSSDYTVNPTSSFQQLKKKDFREEEREEKVNKLFTS